MSTSDQSRGDRSPLLGRTNDERLPNPHSLTGSAPDDAEGHKRRSVLGSVVTFLFILAVVLGWALFGDRVGRDPLDEARQMLSRTPIIDGHIDLPILVRFRYANNVSAFDLNGRMPGHVDIPRLREGKVGGFFWSVYVDCKPEGPYFTTPSYRVRDTLEQIDVAKLMIGQYPNTFQFAEKADDITDAMHAGKIASILGVEGAHQLGNSLSVLRQYHALGVRYVTLTHGCHNAFADSGGIIEAPEPLHNGLSKLGRALVYELNRLGVLVDLSHTSDATALQAMALTQAPVIWSHSSARAVHNVSRNVPDEILSRLGTEEKYGSGYRAKGKVDGVVMVNFAPFFVAPDGAATLERVADHIEHIGRVAGREHVGLGSDFDGIGTVPEGLEDVSKYPQLIAELIKRKWTRQDVAGVAGGNLLRVLRGAERAAWAMRVAGARPSMALYDKRPDLPVTTIGRETEGL